MAIDVRADPSGQVAPLFRRPRSAITTIDLLLTEFLRSAVCGRCDGGVGVLEVKSAGRGVGASEGGQGGS